MGRYGKTWGWQAKFRWGLNLGRRPGSHVCTGRVSDPVAPMACPETKNNKEAAWLFSSAYFPPRGSGCCFWSFMSKHLAISPAETDTVRPYKGAKIHFWPCSGITITERPRNIRPFHKLCMDLLQQKCQEIDKVIPLSEVGRSLESKSVYRMHEIEDRGIKDFGCEKGCLFWGTWKFELLTLPLVVIERSKGSVVITSQLSEILVDKPVWYFRLKKVSPEPDCILDY